MPDTASRTGALRVLLAALFLSGSAGLINQVVWQRALKIFLGGSETLSSTIVVVVFMFGLGVGSQLIGTRAERLRNPLMALAITELVLGVVNVVVCWLLGLDIGDSVYAVQRLAVGAGVPLRLMYSVAALVLLGPPCLLMGMTMALSSESSQRQLGFGDTELISELFFVNTLGALVGALGTGFYLMPHFGQRTSLLVAAGGNVLAGIASVALARGTGDVQTASLVSSADRTLGRRRRLRVEEVTGFILGFVALSYEMVLFRLATLVHGPLPETFAAVLCGFLLAWSFGVWCSRTLPERIGTSLFVSAVLLVLTPTLFATARSVWVARASLAFGFVPCVFFGVLYGHIVTRSATRWGRDVGRFYALNTLGSCLGVLFFTLVGYEIDLISGGVFLAAGLLGSLVVWKMYEEGSASRFWRVAAVGMPAVGVTAIGVGLSVPVHLTAAGRVFYGRDGVVEVRGTDLIWDGLWHSSLSTGGDHVGTHNWLVAIAPLVAHEGPVADALVIGLGAGITASTLADVKQIGAVDTYEINHTLRPFLAAYQDGTLGAGTNPRINIVWQDGRTGLALNDKRYDLITQQPLYLKQAGSSILLSQEYLRLVQTRLKPGGVLALYSNSSGNEEEALLVRQTVQSVFRYCESFEQGYMVIASDSPIDLSEGAVNRRLDLYPAIKEQVVRLETLRSTPAQRFRFHDLYDSTRLAWAGSPFVITDDHPLVEYPELVHKLLSSRR